MALSKKKTEGADRAQGATGSSGHGPNSARERLTTIAKPLRLAIVTRLQLEPGSAAEVAEYLGVDAETVRHQLRRLYQSGQVKRLGRRKRHGAAEYVYSGDPRCNLLRPGGQPMAPSRLVDEAQSRLLRLMFGEASAALDAHTFASRDEHALIRFPLPLDERGWEEAVGLHGELLDSTLDEIERAGSRIEKSDEQPIPASVALLFFENPLTGWPYPPTEDPRRSAPARRAPATHHVDDVRGLADPVTFELIDALSIRPAGASELANQIAIPVEKVRYELDRLRRAGMIRVCGERQRRGTVERLYIGENRNALFDHVDAINLQGARKNAFNRLVVNKVFREAVEATRAGAFHDRDDFYLARIPMRIDMRGFISISALISAAALRLFDLRDRCLAALEEGEAPPRLAFSDLLLFEQAQG